MTSKIVVAAVLCACTAFCARGAESTSSLPVPAGAKRITLWAKTPNVVEGKDRDTDPTIPTLDIYLAQQAKTPGAAFLVLPGGGYTHLSTTKEGSDIAHFLNRHDISAFVLRYRHAPRYHNPIPLEDAQRAMRIIRTNASEYHIDPDRIGVIGFSAGGHLAASLATAPATTPATTHTNPGDKIDKASARPDFAALIYPVIDFTDDKVVHKGSRQALMGDENVNNMAMREALSPEKHVTQSTPPTFLVQAATDKTVPVMNSVLFFEACHSAGVSAELHIFSNGPHGFGLAPGNPQLHQWPELMLHWLAAEKQIPAADIHPSARGRKAE